MARSAKANARASAKAGPKAEATRVAAGSGQLSALWWGLLACGAVLVVSPASAILLLALLLPAVLVAMVPAEPRTLRPAQAVLLFGLAGAVQPVHSLWTAGGDPQTALQMIHQPAVLMMSWAGILGGWLLGELASLVLRLSAELAASRERGRLMQELSDLEEEWGPLPPPIRETDR